MRAMSSNPRIKTLTIISCFVTLLMGAAGCGPQNLSGDTSEDSSSFIRAANPIAGRYIVVLNPETMEAPDVDTASTRISRDYSASVHLTYHHAVTGFAAAMTEDDALSMSHDSRVAFVEEDSV